MCLLYLGLWHGKHKSWLAWAAHWLKMQTVSICFVPFEYKERTRQINYSDILAVAVQHFLNVWTVGWKGWTSWWKCRYRWLHTYKRIYFLSQPNWIEIVRNIHVSNEVRTLLSFLNSCVSTVKFYKESIPDFFFPPSFKPVWLYSTAISVYLTNVTSFSVS